jgi:pimeloyl-ACP methyl ester carboxylesterase
MSAGAAHVPINVEERVLNLPHGIRVRLIEAGSGPTVLLLHGNPDNADEWLPLMAQLAPDFRCLAPDLPGYGRRGSTYALPPEYHYSQEQQVAFVDALLDQVGIHGDITLALHDIGGIMSIPWAARNTDRLHAVIYTNTVAYPGFRWFDLAYRWGRDGPAGRGLARASMAALAWSHGQLFRRVFSRQHPQLSPSEIERFVEHFALNPIAKATTLREFRSITRADFFDGYDRMLQAISASAPTLAVWGEGDPYVPDRFASQLFARETITLPKVGHWAPIVAADALAEHIRALYALRGASSIVTEKSAAQANEA